MVVRAVLPLLLFATACGTATVASTDSDPPATLEPVTLTLSLYVVDELAGEADPPLSSRRSVAEVEQIAERVQDIWDQAGIELDIETVTRVDAPTEALSGLTRGETGAFLDDLFDGTISVPDPGAINGFYVESLGRINGVAPFGSRLFFVTDQPSVHDERVSSHEIGHILGLHHAADDSSRLMFSGTNGMELLDGEIGTSRYVAQGIIDGMR
jgi:hypothetical protein